MTPAEELEVSAQGQGGDALKIANAIEARVIADYLTQAAALIRARE